ncbi:MAG: helix-hairpin-helix domain-containing protein [Thermoguttaceae bacterium]|nr:helix-hairpin-helix domain-containing protein [Thermoguttaceae bacterium]MDW8037503.1 Tex-like N-terminal domain-containing protein [Thermoguttaceae bacterium]
MIEPVTIHLRPIARALRITYRQVEAVAQLLEEGKSVPFIARYRKDQTNGLEEEQIWRIRSLLRQARLLAQRKETILRSLQVQGKWTPELDRQIRTATTSRRLEDLYLPYKPKKEGLATTARDRGLEPLAEEILQAAPTCANLEARAADFVNPDKQVRTPADALLGAGHILAEMISEHADLRKKLREVFYRTARICSRLLETVPLPPGWQPKEKKSTIQASAPAPEPTSPSKPPEISTDLSASEGAQMPLAQQPMEAESGSAESSSEPGKGLSEQASVQNSSDASFGGATSLDRDAASQVVSGGTYVSEDVSKTSPESLNGSSTAPQNHATPPASEPSEPSEPSGQNSSSAYAESSGSLETEQLAEAEARTKLQEELQPQQGAEACAGDQTNHSLPTASVQAALAAEEAPEGISEPQPSAAGAQPLSQADLRRQQKELKKQRLLQQRLRAYQDFFDFQESIRKVSHYRVLCLNRGERQKILRVWIECDREAMRQVLYQECVPPEHPHADFLRGCADDALERLLLPSLEREARRELTEQAEAHAVEVVSKSLRKMLLQRPVRGKRILAVDPGLRNGYVLAALDEFGNLLEHAELYLVGRTEDRQSAKEKLVRLIRRYRIGVVGIGNGPGARLFEDFLAELVNGELKTEDLQYGIVSQIGAKAYARSSVGQEEFPYYDVRVRSAIFIGRRLLDPLSELVKVEPAHLATGIYQHDVKAKHLEPLLEEVVESCVNRVGVDVNTAHPWLLRYVSGLNMVLARRLEEYRREHGPFRTRTDLKQIPGFGEGTFELAAGFLKILHGPEPLDRTGIHPDSYPLAQKILEKVSAQAQDLWNPAVASGLQKQLGQLDVQTLAQELGAGIWTVRQVLGELRRAGRDPRDDSPALSFKRARLKPEELQPDMELTGTVVHITNFGAFVDIGAGENGLVHISQLAPRYVRDPREVVSVGDSVKVWVLQVDLERRRISLSMIPPDQRTQTAQAPRVGKAPREKPPSAAPEKRAPVPGEKTPSSAVGQPIAKPSLPQRAPAATGASQPASKPSARQFRSKAPPPPPPKLSEAVKQGKQPMRTFAELLQFFQLTRQQQQTPAPAPSPKGEPSPKQPPTAPASPSADKPSSAASSPSGSAGGLTAVSEEASAKVSESSSPPEPSPSPSLLANQEPPAASCAGNRTALPPESLPPAPAETCLDQPSGPSALPVSQKTPSTELEKTPGESPESAT